MRIYKKTTVHPYCIYLTEKEMDSIIHGDGRESAEAMISLRRKLINKFRDPGKCRSLIK